MTLTCVRWRVGAAANLAAKCASAVVMQLLLLPAYGLHPTLGQALQTSVRFTLLSLLHGAVVGRPNPLPAEMPR